MTTKKKKQNSPNTHNPSSSKNKFINEILEIKSPDYRIDNIYEIFCTKEK
jgi:hypothetical protein